MKFMRASFSTMALLALCATSQAQTATRAAPATPASAIASRPVTTAPISPSAQPGAERSMIELQSTLGQRATQLEVTKGQMKPINESMKAIAGNIGRDGAAAGCRKCTTSAKMP